MFWPSLRGFSPGVAVMEAAHSALRDDPGSVTRPRLHRTQVRSVFLKCDVAAVFGVVADILPKESPEVALVEDHHAIQQLAPAASDPAALPHHSARGSAQRSASARCPSTGSSRRHSARRSSLGRTRDRRARCRTGTIPELLHHPGHARMLGDMELDDLPATVLDREPDGEDSKRCRRHREEVHRREYLAVIPKERPPLVERSHARAYSRQVPRALPAGAGEEASS